MIRLTEFRLFGCHICPDVSETCCNKETTLLFNTLRSALESYKFQFNSMTPCPSFLATQARFPWKLWPSWRHEVNVVSFVTWHLPSRRVRSEICCQILSSTRRIYLRLPLLTLLDMRPGMYSSLEVLRLDLPRRLERLGVGTSLCLRLLLLRRRSLNPSSWTHFTPHKKSPDPPRGFFGDSGLFSLWVV